MRTLNPFTHEQTLGVLLLDSDIFHLHEWSALLSSAGYRVYIAHNCFEAALHFSHSIQCVVLENQLPDMLGVEFIRNFAVTGNPEFILLTNEDNSMLRDKALAAGAKAVIQKPTTIEDLVAHIEDACRAVPHQPPQGLPRSASA